MEKWNTFEIEVSGTFPKNRELDERGEVVVERNTDYFGEVDNWVRFYYPGE